MDKKESSFKSSFLWQLLVAYDRFAYWLGDKLIKTGRWLLAIDGTPPEKGQLDLKLKNDPVQKLKHIAKMKTKPKNDLKAPLDPWQKEQDRNILNTAVKALKYTLSGLLIVMVSVIVLPFLPLEDGFQTMVVMSGSMEPAILSGSLAVVREADQYQKGDIVTFQTSPGSEQTITHRIYQVEQTNGQKLFVTKGDANEDVDPQKVPPGQIQGKFVFALPLLGYLVSFTQTTVGFVVMIIIPAMLIIFDESRIIREELSKRNSPEETATQEQNA